MEKILLSRYFKNKNIAAKEDQLELKPSPKGLIKLKERLDIGDWEMLYVGDGHDDYIAAKGANVFFAMITQGLVADISTIREMKKDAEFGSDFVKKNKSKMPKFIVAFTYDELLWWFKESADFRKQIKAVCFDLGDTLVVGGREEAYHLTDNNWPTWDVDRLLEESKTHKKLREAILNIRIEGKWRKLGSLPAMNSSEVRIASFFLLHLFGLKDKDLVSVLYSEVDKTLKSRAEELSKKADIPLNTKTISEGMTVMDLATVFPPEQFSLFIASGLSQILKREKQKHELADIAVILKSSFFWIAHYRKHEMESYRKHCKVPRGLKELLNFLVKKRKKLCIYTSKSRNIVETALAFEKDIAK